MSCKANFSTQCQPCYNASIRRSKIGKRSNLLTIDLFQNFHNILFCPSKIGLTILDLQSPHEKLKTMLMQYFGGTTKSIMVFLKKANYW